MKRVLVILGHPGKKSFCSELVRKYINGARKSGAKVRTIYLSDLKFDPILHNGYNKIQPLEKDLIESQKLIKWADHLVLVYPMWWYNMPALLKGFIDRIFLPGFAFNRVKNSVIPRQHLRGKSARLIITAGNPWWIYKILGNPAKSSMKTGTLIYSGIWPVRTTMFSSIFRLTEKKAEKIFKKVEKLGKKLK
jgi:NAD(P)H dehydrogenase (quinone)